MHTLFLRAVFAWQRQLAKRRGIAGRVHPGAVTFIQRFGGQLNLNVHFHAVVPDGVFAEDSPGGRVSFHPLPGPRDEDVLAIAHRVVRRILAALERAADRDADTPPDDESAALDAVQAAAVETRSLLPATPSTAPLSFHRRSVAFDGFSLHAAVQIPAADRAGLERLCRYGARPAFASERLTLTAAGQVSYRLKRPWPDGRTHLILPPVAFRRRLAGILPPPRRHLLRYAGVFAPRAALRSRVVALAPAAATTTASTAVLPPPHRQPTRLPWADLLQRVFAVDVLACPCGGRRRVLAFITDLDVARSILTALGLPATIPTFAPARGPHQQSFDDWLD